MEANVSTPLNYKPGVYAGGRTGSFFLQVYATIRRQITQKRRAPIACLLEVLLPVAFAGLLAFIASFADVIPTKGEQFITPNAYPKNFTDNINNALCYQYGGSDAYLSQQLGNCSSSVAYCNVAGSDLYFSTVPEGVCIQSQWDASTAASYVSYFTDATNMPDFDSYVKLQWIVRLYYRSNKDFDRSHILRTFGPIIFAPNQPHVYDLVADLNKTYALFRYAFSKIVESRESVLSQLLSEEGTWKTWAVVEAYKGASTFDQAFIISVNHTAVPSTTSALNKFAKGEGRRDYLDYYSSGFLTLQQALSQYYFRQNGLTDATAPSGDESISFAAMGFASYIDNTFFTIAGRVAPLIQVLSFLYTVSQLSKRLVEEKEQRLREGTMIMGLTRAAFFSSWMIIYYFQITITSVLSSALLAKWLMTKTSFLTTFFLYLLFGFTVVNVAALMSTFFNKSRIAALVVPLLYFMMSIPSFALPDGTPPGTYILLSWIPTIPFAIGNILLCNYETLNGLGAADIASAQDNDPYNMASCFTFLVINIVFCPMLMLYLDAILPKEWGSRRHPCYCISYLWYRIRGIAGKRDDDGAYANDAEDATGSPSPFMKDSSTAVDVYPGPNRDTTVHIRKVRKEFAAPSGKKVAVDDVDLRMFPGMVTVLLGHNGAGKTTLMNMMTGMLDMTSGDVSVYGVSVHDDLDAVRRNVGYCPQHNILWDDLTCIEHLRYFARLKGVPGDMVEEEATRLLERVDLLDKKEVFSKQLSGGQKRKLSVAIAFIGGSQLILLDEPTAGMDVTARRHTWEIIREMAADRTILLTTHFMDEADLLGSRVAIMSKGRLHSYGSPMFLKSKLGSGYILRISLNGAVTDEGAAMLREASMVIPNVSIREVKGQEVALVLSKEDATKFPAILRHFESSAVKSKYNISGVSMTVSTLEDVFLRIAEDEEAEVIIPDGADPTAARSPTSPSSPTEKHKAEEMARKEAFAVLERSYKDREVAGSEVSGSIFRQLFGLFIKRFHYARRDNRTIFFQLAMPLLCLLLAMLLSYLGPGNQPKLWIDTGMYNGKELVSINKGDGITQYYSQNGYDRVEDMNASSTYDFSTNLVLTANANGNTPRYTAISRRAAFAGTQRYTTMMGNATATHSAPQALGDYYANIAREQSPKNTPISLRFASWPLPMTDRETAQVDAFKQLFIALFVLIPFTFIPSTYVSFIVRERECKAKHLQFVSGVQYIVYWFSNFLFDFIAFVFTACCSMIIFAIFKRDEFVGDVESGFCTFLILTLYGVSGIFAAYCISFLFKSHSSAQNIVMIVNFLVGFCLVMASFILKQLGSTKDTMKALVYIFRLFPAFCLGEGIMNMAVEKASAKLSMGTQAAKGPFHMDVAGCGLLYMAGSAFLFMILTLIVDHPKRKEKQRMMGFNAGVTAPMPEDEDEDVIEERNIVANNQRPDDVISVKGLRKVYPIGLTGEKVAVQNITFGVKQGEVFGFLGTNGAGKTTTMGVLTGEFVPTMGEAYVAGFDVVREAQEAFKVIGYCPQFDALLDLLTPTEHLNLYAALRGIPTAQTTAVVDALILTCGLDEFRKIPAMKLSGGNKRKLSVAIALMGGPKLVFLDEPSAGMDPHARRMLWDVIVFVAKHSSVLLTTHHLEEVDVLAHRVGIMDKGLMKCMGSLEHLKRKFGSGFELTIRVSDYTFENAAAEFINKRFPNATLVEAREQRLVFAMASETTSLADLFEEVQRATTDPSLGISDYIVQQTSLENVFLKITVEAAEEEQAVAAATASGEAPPTPAEGIIVQRSGTEVVDLEPIKPAAAGYTFNTVLRQSATNRASKAAHHEEAAGSTGNPDNSAAVVGDNAYSPREE